MGLLILLLVCYTDKSRAEVETAGAAWGYYANSLKVPGVNPEIDSASSATCFGGHVKPAADAPRGGSYRLVASSFGQAVAHEIPYPGFQQAALNTSKEMLYYENAVDPTSAAFRYKAILYEAGVAGITAQFQNMQTLWTDGDRQKALAAARLIRNAIKYDPFNSQLRNALLDIYYDMAVADLTKATEMMVEAQKAALGEEFGYIAPPGEFLISEEIKLIRGDSDEGLTGALQLYDEAMRPYF